MMKNSPLILMFFCTALTWSRATHATDTPWESEIGLQSRHSSHNGLFDFADYEARMASLDTADQKAEREVNTLYTPLDIHYDKIRHALDLSLVAQPLLEGGVPLNLPDRLNEEDSLMQKILAESVRTANLEQTQRELDTTKEETIKLNEKIGELTGIVEKRLAEKDNAMNIYLSFIGSDAEIEAIEDHEEKTRRLKACEEQKARARDIWVKLHMLHAAAEENLKELEAKEAIASDQYVALSTSLESLKQESNDLGIPVEDK